MQAWLSENLITVEGTSDEWRLFILRLVSAYEETQTYDYLIHEFAQAMKEMAEQNRRKPATSTKRPDIEWYDRHQK